MPEYTMTIEITTRERCEVTVDADTDAEARHEIVHGDENYEHFPRDRSAYEVCDVSVKVIRPKRHPVDAQRDFDQHVKGCATCSRTSSRLIPCRVALQLLDDVIEAEA